MVNSADIKRASQVVGVLSRQGLGYFVHRFGLAWHLPLVEKINAPPAKADSVPQRLRKSIEQLGGAFIKLGQFLDFGSWNACYIFYLI